MQTRGAGIGGPGAKLRYAKQNSTVRPTRLESSGSVVRVLIAPPISRRTAEISRSGPKYPRIGASRPVDLVSGFSHSASTDVMAVLSLHP
jgi:hypothetical protein